MLCLAMLFFPVVGIAQSRLVPNKVTLKDGKSFSLNLPTDFEIIPALEGLKRVRFSAKAPDGRIFATDMFNLTDNKRGTVYILDGWNAETGKFTRAIPYMTNLRNPNSVQFYRDPSGQDWLYLAETDKLTRRRFARGEIKPTDARPRTLATFPGNGLSYKYGGWHLTRTIAFSPAGKLYISVGSSCNACKEKEKVRASIVEMNPDGSGQREFARGLRNAVGLRWFGNFLFAANQGSDHLGLEKPDETFYSVKDGADYGWPYCHSSGGKVFADPGFKRPGQCTKVTAPYAWFPARSSALGFDYFDDADSPELIKNAFLVSLHGSTNKAIGHGYKIVIMRKGEKLHDLVTGFLQRGKVVGRPCDILKLTPTSFLFSDDFTGTVYLVRQKGTASEITDTLSPVPEENSAIPTDGKPKACLSAALVIASFLFCSSSKSLL
ncbi:MAG: glucose/sorbosone dehydrogenase [Pyrinomonadaceae bacterium]